MLADADKYVKAFDAFQASSHAALTRAFNLVTRVAPSRRPFLVCGETGTGKEVVARAIHEYAATEHDRRYGTVRPFVPINCANLPTELVEAELFGHVKGAFTGASAARPGLFAQANEGTIFLDEIGEMPLSLQAKLLRVLDSMEIKPIGATAAQKINVMVVAATNRKLDCEVREGRFREDLFHRLAVARIDLPPLRERSPEEIQALADYYVRRNTPHGEVKKLSDQARSAIVQHPWPGNIRELENRVGLATTLSEGPEIEIADLDFGAQAKSLLEDVAADRLAIIHKLIEHKVGEIQATGRYGNDLRWHAVANAISLALRACDRDTARAARAMDCTEEEIRPYQDMLKGKKAADIIAEEKKMTGPLPPVRQNVLRDSIRKAVGPV